MTLPPEVPYGAPGTYQLAPSNFYGASFADDDARSPPPRNVPASADPLDGLLSVRTNGLENLVERLDSLIRERGKAGEDVGARINRDEIYLENLILDRYRHGDRPTDDRAYVTLRLQQLRLHQEARLEEVSRWRDTVLLAKEVADLARRVDEARRQEDFLRGDAP